MKVKVLTLSKSWMYSFCASLLHFTTTYREAGTETGRAAIFLCEQSDRKVISCWGSARKSTGISRKQQQSKHWERFRALTRRGSEINVSPSSRPQSIFEQLLIVFVREAAPMAPRISPATVFLCKIDSSKRLCTVMCCPKCIENK